MSESLPEFSALRTWACDTAGRFNLIERVVVYRPTPSANSHRDPDTQPVEYLMVVKVLGMPEDPHAKIEDDELGVTLEQLRTGFFGHALNGDGGPGEPQDAFGLRGS